MKQQMTNDLFKVAEDSARSGFFLISGTTLATIILATSAILIGRFLGPELYGQYSLTLTIPSLLFLFADLGIDSGVTKFTASMRAQGATEGRLKDIIRRGLIIKAIAGITLFAICYAFADEFATLLLQRPELGFYVRLSSISILFQVILANAISGFVGLDKTEYNALATNVQALGKTISQIALVLLGFGVAGAVIGHVAGYIVASIAAAAILYLLLRGKQTIENYKFKEDFNRLIHYGAPLYVSAIIIGFIPLYQSFMLALFATDLDIGNFKASQNFVALLGVLSIPIATALLPAFSKLDSTHSNSTKRFFRLANKYTSVIVVPITLLFIIFSNEMVSIIYESKYTTAATFLATYSALYLLVGIGYLTVASFFNGMGLTRMTLEINLIKFFTVIVLSPLLTGALNVQGLILAFIIANLAGTFYGSYNARKNFKVSFDTKSIIKIYVVSSASSIPPLILGLAQLPGLFYLIIGALMFLLIYITLIPLTRIMSLTEIQMAAQLAQRIRPLTIIAKPVLKYQEKILRAFTTA